MKHLQKRLSRTLKRLLCFSMVVLLTAVSVVSVASALSASQGQNSAPETVPSVSPTPLPAPVINPQPTPQPEPSPFVPAAPAQPDSKPATQEPAVKSPPSETAPTGEKPEQPTETAKPATEDKPAEKSPEAIARWQKFAAADRLYRDGEITAAEKLYREVKPPFPQTTLSQEAPLPITDPAMLSPAGKVYWREAEAGRRSGLETRLFVPLKLLVEKYPEFLPGHLQLAEAYEQKGKLEEAVAVLDRAASLYPDQPDLLRSRITLLAKTEQWIEASIAARQFALLHPDHPAAAEFATLAEDNLKRYRKDLRSRITGNVIGNILTGAVGYAVTGNLFGPLSAIQSSILLLRGESAVGERYARQAQRQLPMVEDEAVLKYVDGLGQKLAKLAGRDDFKYEFFVVQDDNLNAFALPGGKVFVNTGAIAKTYSEAELSGLLAHELSHAVLSHGFQLVTRANLTANLFQFIPYGGLAADLLVLNYSRDMERQADILGTRLLAASGYAADGLRNLMVTLNQQDKQAPPIDFLSSHPITGDRIQYLETLITRSNYNRYTYEGVEDHAKIQERVKSLSLEKPKRPEENQP